MSENTIKWDKDADGIVTLTLDDPTGSANVMNEHYKESMHNAVNRLVAEKEISVNQFVVRDGYLLLDDDIFDNLLVHTEIF